MRFKLLMLCLEKRVSKSIANIIEFHIVENIRPSEHIRLLELIPFTLKWKSDR